MMKRRTRGTSQIGRELRSVPDEFMGGKLTVLHTKKADRTAITL
jgi:hypothetical protein